MANDQNPEQIAEENRNALDIGSDPVEPRQEPAPAAGKQQEGEPVEPKAPVRGSKFDEKRNRIAEMARKAREPEPGDTEIEEISASRDRMFGKNVETHADRETRRAAPSPEPAKPQDAPQPAAKRKLKVNGQEVELDDEQVVAYAQKALAADNILEQAKTLRNEQLSILEGLRAARGNQPADAAPPNPSPQAPVDTTPADDADLDEIIDKIQVGDPSEAKAALAKYGTSLEKRILDRIGNLDEAISSRMEIVNENARRQQETRETLESFARDHSEFKQSRALQAALATELVDTMRERMFEIGVEQASLDRLKAERGFNDTEAVGFAYRTLQARGVQLPSHAEMLTQSAASIRKQFGIVTQKQVQQPQNFDAGVREERKRALVTQPRRANVPSNLDQQERSRQDVRLQAVRDMRKARRGRA